MNGWALSVPELAEIISQFEKEYEKLINHYHQQKITMNAVKLFKQIFIATFQLENLAVINNTSQIFDGNIFHNIAKLESIGFMQLKAFISNELISCKTSINSKIALNHLILLNDDYSKKPHGKTAEKRLTTQFLTKFRDA